MELTVCTLLVVLSLISVTHSTHFSGTITENTTFFYRKLAVAPSVRATIEFNVSYSKTSMRGKFPLIGIYTEYPNRNIEKRCSYVTYGQLRNENLHPYLRLGRYRTTTCELFGFDTVNCNGRADVQDFMPRNFYLTFGFHCHWPPIYSLKGLWYNITFTMQTNETKNCMKYTEKFHTKVCSNIYQQTSLPNLIGDESLDEIFEYFDVYKAYETASFLTGRCYKHIEEISCHIIFPKCDPVTKQVTHPCREMCWDIKEACLQKLFSMVKKLFLRYDWGDKFLGNWSKEVNCDYLPSFNGSIPCFYKPVTCDSPPDVTNGTTILNITQKDIYQLQDAIQYACVNESFQMIGNDSTTCLYSGQWSHSPPTCSHQVTNPLHPLLVVLPVLLVSLSIFTSVAFCAWCCQTKHNVLKRNKEYDAFVCYCYEGGEDSDFAEKIIPQELEEKHGLSLCIHRRDFKAGWDIKWNIMNAIRNSNSAIISMSQDYMNSLWCVEEFEDCYMENMKDPAFKLFVVLMQPADALDITNEYIKSFFTKKTYVERKDPKLFRKIAEYLNWVKQLKIGKPALEQATEETIDPLLGKNINQNEHKVMEEDKLIRNLKNTIEVDGNSGDSDDQVLCAGYFENISEYKGAHGNLQILVEVHNTDSD